MAQEFKIRSYGKTELGLLYNPDITPNSACRKLMEWIHANAQLTQHLYELGYQEQKRKFTPAMVSAIVDIIGEP